MPGGRLCSVLPSTGCSLRCVWVFLAGAAVLAVVNSPYLGWDYGAPETAVMRVSIHAFEWGFVRLAPFALIAALVGVFLTRKRT